MSATTLNRPKPAANANRGPLLVLGGIAMFGLLAFVGRDHVSPLPSHEASAMVAQLDLRFVDRADGGVGVLNAADGSTVTVIAPGQDNFVRATMRGLARQRAREDVGAELPFRLTAWADGRLTLQDPGTGRAVELESFGATNEANFARMLKLPGAAS